jgi:hypothetical protein
MQHEAGAVHGPRAFYDVTLVINQQQVGHAHAARIHCKRIVQYMFVCSGSRTVDVTSETILTPILREDAAHGSQTLVSMQALLNYRSECRILREMKAFLIGTVIALGSAR